MFPLLFPICSWRRPLQLIVFTALFPLFPVFYVSEEYCTAAMLYSEFKTRGTLGTQ